MSEEEKEPFDLDKALDNAVENSRKQIVREEIDDSRKVSRNICPKCGAQLVENCEKPISDIDPFTGKQKLSLEYIIVLQCAKCDFVVSQRSLERVETITEILNALELS